MPISHQTLDATVIVIGAGMAGLAAAHQLQKAGKKVIVLEARDRIGGRIFSQKIDQNIYDLGASWMHGIEGNPVWEITQQNHIQSTVFNYDASHSQYFHANGQGFSSKEQQRFEQSLAYLLDQFQILDQAVHGQNALDAFKALITGEDFQSFIRQFDLEQTQKNDLEKMLLHFFNLLAEDPCATDLSSLSAEFWKKEGFYAGDEAVFPQGYSQVIEVLAKDVKILTQQVVQTIDYTQDVVQVTTTQGQRFVADQLLLTVPLGVLKESQIKFVPELPELKKRAIQNMGYGVFNKLFVRFDHAFWQSATAQQKNSTLIYDSQRWLNFLDMQAVYQQPVLLFLFGGASALETEQMTAKALWQQLSTSLKAVFKQLPEPLEVFKTEWGMDQFAQGSFSYCAAQQTDDDLDALRQPIAQRLFFAGEHLANFGAGTVHGAYLSGVAAVSDMIEHDQSENVKQI